MSHSFHNKLQDNAESSDTCINKCLGWRNCFAILCKQSIGQPIDRFIGQFVISHNFAHCKTWDELFNMIIEFITHFVDNFDWGRVKGEIEVCIVEGKSYTSSFSRRKLVFVRVTDTSFLLLFTDNTFTTLFQWDWSTIMNLWDGMDYCYWTFCTESIKRVGGNKQQCNS